MSRIAIVLTPRFADWEYGLISGTGGPFYGLDIRFFASEAGVLTSQGGLCATVERGLGDLVDWAPQVVAVIGGMAWVDDEPPDLGAILRKLREAGTTVAGICGGTLALARAGLLDRVAHTANDSDFLTSNSPNYAGRARYIESAVAVSDGEIITAPGTAPASFAAEVFAAAGLDAETLHTFRRMTAAEHLSPR
jgi:putative intracellular protease/amidase